MQYVPDNGIYTYFRYNPEKTVMVVMNTAEKTETLKTDCFAERMSGFGSAVNIATGEHYQT